MLKDRLQKTGSRIYMLFKQDPLLHVLIFLFAGLICFFPASPSVTCTGLILMCGPAVLLQTYVLRRRRFRTISTVTGLIASAAMYTLSITADNTGVSAVLLNLSALWLFTVLLQYVTCDATDNAVSAVYERFLQFIKSGAVATLICILLAVILLFTALILPSGIYFDIVRGNFCLALWILLFFIVLFSYNGKPSAPGRLYTRIFKTVVPKFSVFSGILAVIYLFLILIDVRPDARFLYTYYPYVTLYYLFFLASFRIKEKVPEQPLILVLFSALTALCLILTIKRVYVDSSLILGAVYIILFNGLFLLHNLYLLIRRTGPGPHTKLLALVMGLIMFMPLIGYTSFIRFVTYTHEGDTYVPHFSVVGQFDGSIEKAQAEANREEAARRRQGEQQPENTVIFRPRAKKQVSYDIAPYTAAILNLNLSLSDDSSHSTHADKGFTFALADKGNILVITAPDGSTERYDLPDTVRQNESLDEHTSIIVQTDTSLLVISQYFNNGTTTTVTFDFFGK